MDMEKSTQPQGLESLNKSMRTPQASSKTLQFDLREGRNYGGAIRKKAEFPEYRVQRGSKDKLIEVFVD